VDTLFKATERVAEKKLAAEERERLLRLRQRGSALGGVRSKRSEMKRQIQREAAGLVGEGKPFNPIMYEAAKPAGEITTAQATAQAMADAEAQVQKKYADDLADLDAEEQAIALDVDPAILRMEAERVGTTMARLLAAVAEIRKGGPKAAAAQKVMDDYGIDLRSL